MQRLSYAYKTYEIVWLVAYSMCCSKFWEKRLAITTFQGKRSMMNKVLHL